MSHATSFQDLLDAVELLSADEQETLVELVQHRVAERRRKRVAAEIADARTEFANDACQPVTPDELLSEIKS